MTTPRIALTIGQWFRAATASRVRRNLFTGMLAAGGNTALTLISYPLLLRLLGYERYGVWLLLATLITFVQMTNLGISQAVAKLTAEACAEADEEAFSAYTTAASVVLAVIGAIGLLVVIALRGRLPELFAVDGANAGVIAQLAPWAGAVSAYALLVQVEVGALAGIGRSDLSNWALLLQRFAALGLWVVALLAGKGLGWLVAGTGVSYLLMHLVTLFWIRHDSCYRTFRLSTLRADRTRTLLRFGAGAFGSTVLSLVFHPVNRVLVSRYAGVECLPVLEIGYAGAMQVRALFETALRSLMPEFSRVLASTKDPSEHLGRLLRGAHLFILTFAVPVFGCAVLVAPVLISWWLSGSFRPELVPVFRVMAVGAFASLCGVPVFYLAMGTGRMRVIITSSLVQLVASLAFSLAIAQLNGFVSPLDVAIGVLVGYFLSTGYLLGCSHALLRKV